MQGWLLCSNGEAIRQLVSFPPSVAIPVTRAASRQCIPSLASLGRVGPCRDVCLPPHVVFATAVLDLQGHPRLTPPRSSVSPQPITTMITLQVGQRSFFSTILLTGKYPYTLFASFLSQAFDATTSTAAPSNPTPNFVCSCRIHPYASGLRKELWSERGSILTRLYKPTISKSKVAHLPPSSLVRANPHLLPLPLSLPPPFSLIDLSFLPSPQRRCP